MSNVVWNTGTNPIFITLEYEADPIGGPAMNKRYICVAPGEGIDLDITTLRRREPPVEQTLRDQVRALEEQVQQLTTALQRSH